MARPRKSIKESRNIKIEILLNEYEYEKILENSIKLNKKRSAYMRERCLDHRIHTFGVDFSEFFFELGKIGVNLNQFVKKVNSLKSENPQLLINFLNKEKLEEIDEALKFIRYSKKMWLIFTNVK